MKICVITESDAEYQLTEALFKKLGIRSVRQRSQVCIYEKDIEMYSEQQAVEGVAHLSGGKPVLVLCSAMYDQEHPKEGFPGMLTQKLWEEMPLEEWNTLMGEKTFYKKTVLAYSDGKIIKTFCKKEKGKLESIKEKKGSWQDYFRGEQQQLTYDLLREFEAFFIQSGLQEKWEKGKENREKVMEQLAELIRQRKLILFVGAGVSANLGIPTWDELMSYIAKDESIGYHPGLFKEMGNYLELMEYYGQKKGGIEELKQWMSKEWNQKEITEERMGIHEAIVKLGFPLIYTTNFEHWIERAFKGTQPVEVISTIEDMQKMREETTKVIKFHGDCEKTQLVLTEESHFERLDFESALDIKFRADLLNHSVLFVGYSLSDMNVRYMLYRMQKLREKFGEQCSRPNIYILTHKYNEVKQEVLQARGIVTIYQDEEDRGKGLEKFLERLYEKAYDKK